MKNLNRSYSKEHIEKSLSPHWYPTEWVVRTMLGNYPGLSLDRSIYDNAKILDMGCGDGRNMSLLHNIGLQIHGVEITESIVDSLGTRLKSKGIPAELKVGNNCDIPYGDGYFDVVLASSSMYYVNDGERFEDNVAEYLRVLRKGGLLIANFPELTKSFICQDAIACEHGLIEITSDVHGLRNGYRFKAYAKEDQIREEFSDRLTDISVAYLYENYYGYELSMYLMTGYKR